MSISRLERVCGWSRVMGPGGPSDPRHPSLASVERSSNLWKLLFWARIVNPGNLEPTPPLTQPPGGSVVSPPRTNLAGHVTKRVGSQAGPPALAADPLPVFP